VIREIGDYLADMLTYAQKAKSFVGAMTPAEFQANETIYLATTRAIEIVGEAARHVPQDFQQRFPSIPWRKIVGMRNILVHNYDGADPEIVHYTATVEMAALIAQLPGAMAEAERR
jgi:uncharacterized protein with HEPN domain